jgi:peptidoglycan-N-acetylmuramic acid deacetylase
MTTGKLGLAALAATGLSACQNTIEMITTTPEPSFTPESPTQTLTPTLPLKPENTATATPVFSVDTLQQSISAEQATFLASHQILNGDTKRNIVLMTYDDSGSEREIDAILNGLHQANAKATFFFLGDHLQTCTNSIQKIYGAGHQIACHGWSHDLPLTELTHGVVNHHFEQFLRTLETILPGYRVRYFRAPFGSVNDSVLQIAASWGMQHVLWTLPSGGIDARTYDTVIKGVKKGSIVLSHMFRYFDYTEAGKICLELVDRGYQLVTVAEGQPPETRWTANS